MMFGNKIRWAVKTWRDYFRDDPVALDDSERSCLMKLQWLIQSTPGLTDRQHGELCYFFHNHESVNKFVRFHLLNDVVSVRSNEIPQHVQAAISDSLKRGKDSAYGK